LLERTESGSTNERTKIVILAVASLLACGDKSDGSAAEVPGGDQTVFVPAGIEYGLDSFRRRAAFERLDVVTL
jgi:hypothetical protein